MSRISGSRALLVTCAALLGCGAGVEPPPALTDDIKSQIEQEDQAVEDAERAQHALSRKG